ncbi:MAG: hypothetical protein D6732_10920 [Methanobacteriota archaeon]|nr:MAG: hypothetical protein D6732_10920 [Euryarchaeota archaeon]
MAGMKITKPDGTIVEIDKSMLKSLSPDQLAALMSSLTQSTSPPPQKTSSESEKIAYMRTPEEIWNGGKRERIGLFLANQYALGMTLETVDIHRDWMETLVSKNYDLYIEKSHLTQYLTRLAEMGYLKKEKIPGRGVVWTTLELLYEHYPQVPMENFQKIALEIT